MIVSDHPILFDGLRVVCARTSDAEIVAESLDVTQAMRNFTRCKPDVAIVDLQLPLARLVIRLLRGLCSRMPILVLTTGSRELVYHGARNPLIQVSKSAPTEVIVDTARTAVLAKKNTP